MSHPFWRVLGSQRCAPNLLTGLEWATPKLSQDGMLMTLKLFEKQLVQEEHSEPHLFPRKQETSSLRGILPKLGGSAGHWGSEAESLTDKAVTSPLPCYPKQTLPLFCQTFRNNWYMLWKYIWNVYGQPSWLLLRSYTYGSSYVWN